MEFVPALLTVLIVAAALLWLGIVAVATPTVDYRLDRRYDVRSSDFAQALSSALATTVVDGNRISALHDGRRFYPEMLGAIGDARRRRRHFRLVGSRT